MIPTYYLTGFIGDGEATAAALGAFLTANPGPVRVVINSGGGIATEGAAIHAELQRHGQTDVLVEGIAASAASLAMMGGRKITVHAAARVMIHDPAAMVFGVADDLRRSASVLDGLALTYAQAYSRASGNPLKTVQGWMAAETWLSAQECVALHFADEIEDAPRQISVAAFDYTTFRSAPADLQAMARKNGWATVSPESKEDSQDA